MNENYRDPELIISSREIEEDVDDSVLDDSEIEEYVDEPINSASERVVNECYTGWTENQVSDFKALRKCHADALAVTEETMIKGVSDKEYPIIPKRTYEQITGKKNINQSSSKIK